MNFKIPAIGAIVSFVLLFIINLIVGNGFGIVLFRCFISAVVVFGLLFGMLFVFQKFFGIDSATFNGEDASPENENDNAVGQQFDLTVGDDDNVVDTADYNNEEISSNESSNESEDFLDSNTGSSFYDQGFSDAGTSGGDLSADTVKEKLGYDASTEDLAKAIRTIMPKDD